MLVVSRLLIAWSAIIIILCIIHPNYSFINFGPNDSLIMFDTPIDTMPKYIVIVSISIINNIFRTLNKNILNPWIVNNIQDYKCNTNHLYAYEISVTHSIYVCINLFVYMNIILNQIDFFIIELCCDFFSTIIVTRYYLCKSSSKPQFPIAVYEPIFSKQNQSPKQTSFGTLV